MGFRYRYHVQTRTSLRTNISSKVFHTSTVSRNVLYWFRFAFTDSAEKKMNFSFETIMCLVRLVSRTLSIGIISQSFVKSVTCRSNYFITMYLGGINQLHHSCIREEDIIQTTLRTWDGRSATIKNSTLRIRIVPSSLSTACAIFSSHKQSSHQNLLRNKNLQFQ